MRVVSWMVIFGAVSALMYRGLAPLLGEGDLHDIDAILVAGTMADDRIAQIAQCVRELDDEPGSQGASTTEPSATEAPRDLLSRADADDVAACRRKVMAQK
ncbi:hypothetical protein F3N42_09055 [Marinihelvus fidelis]|uniref:Uncharacterized protein n=1 Tax=Marinihelvus fidelis TaxID=2613842 RepID=A0A5N0TCA2_9GAMM|nr:hypothetical protein [Marinihelvus fidelis]KAA9131456.1 hypothetical protein F3N42_09055 [Marinihelvus fidelis]